MPTQGKPAERSFDPSICDFRFCDPRIALIPHLPFAICHLPSPPFPRHTALVELDHLFIYAQAGAPEAVRLSEIGLTEGPPNTHPGQGTACRRFFLHNAYIELLWVETPAEVQSALTQPVRLWERWSNRRQGACPFGFCFRPTAPGDTSEAPPFNTRAYSPPYLPDGLSLGVGTNVEVFAEPALFWLSFAKRSDARPVSERPPLVHANGWREITRVQSVNPHRAVPSSAWQAVLDAGVVQSVPGEDYWLEIEFDGEGTGKRADLRPELPLVLRW
jgi:hypothetical protein